MITRTFPPRVLFIYSSMAFIHLSSIRPSVHYLPYTHLFFQNLLCAFCVVGKALCSALRKESVASALKKLTV